MTAGRSAPDDAAADRVPKWALRRLLQMADTVAKSDGLSIDEQRAVALVGELVKR